MTRRGTIVVVGLLATVTLLSACGKKVQPALGSGAIVALIRSDSDAEAADLLAQHLGKDRYWTPRPEKPFKVTQTTIDGLGKHRYDKNIILLCDTSEKGKVLKTVRNVLSDEERRLLGQGRSAVIWKSDSWAEFQNVVVVGAPSSEALLRLVEEEGPGLVDRLEEEVIQVIVRMSEEPTVVPGMGSRTVSRDAWSLLLPEGFKLKNEFKELPLVHYEVTAPPRVVYVHWFEGTADLSVEDLVQFRNEFGFEHYDGDEITEGKVRGELTTLAGMPAARIEGLWGNRKYTIGGPFITYLVSCPGSSRRILLDLIVYAPGMDQIGLLRELEAVARSLKCKE